MVTLQPITPANLLPYRAVRLRALQESPSAFGATYDWEKQLTDADWQRRVAQLVSPSAIGYLAIADQKACGLAVGRIDDNDTAKAHLFSMWVAPEVRNRGVGNQLVSAIIDWAKSHSLADLYLMVTSSNRGAISFYHRLGFVFTGDTEPYPHDPTLVEYEMMRSLRPLPDWHR